MGFKNNYSEAEQFDNNLKPEGNYECMLVKAEERTTRNGATGLNLSFVIRNDVDQKFKNGYIFHTLWKRKQPTQADMQVKGYGFGQVMALGKAAQLPDGKDYDTLEQFVNDLINKPMLLTLYHEEYNGKTQERVSFINPTKFPDCRHIMKSAADVRSDAPAPPKPVQFAAQSATQQSFVDMPVDDDLPF